jgi:hypothetical protein
VRWRNEEPAQPSGVIKRVAMSGRQTTSRYQTPARARISDGGPPLSQTGRFGTGRCTLSASQGTIT